MKKKYIFIGIIVVVIASIIGYFLLNNRESDNSSNDSNINENNGTNNDNTTISTDGKTLIVYYSATGSTKRVAEELAKNLNADLFEIVPEDIYTSADLNWSNDNSRVTKEHNDESLRDVKLRNTKVDNWDNYDTVLIGYPIWWGIAAWPVNNFVKDNDFTGKTVIPFCTSASSSMGQSGTLLKNMTTTGNWLSGQRFSSNVSEKEIKDWINNINK